MIYKQIQMCSLEWFWLCEFHFGIWLFCKHSVVWKCRAHCPKRTIIVRTLELRQRDLISCLYLTLNWTVSFIMCQSIKYHIMFGILCCCFCHYYFFFCFAYFFSSLHSQFTFYVVVDYMSLFREHTKRIKISIWISSSIVFIVSKSIFANGIKNL